VVFQVVVVLASLTTLMTLRVDGVVHDTVTVIFAAFWNNLVADFRRRLLQQLDHVLCGQPVVVQQMGDPYG